ncbi:hypothetical protein E2562_003907 [Oryza meyeriana var. granulata]|uniref:Uncharacterized protein n=1 Tax=Oryza meyeriana var. granulata TaxID=110450 RepID=A0A6G1CYW4_9ORYZ|nr:hypothetical protein E2562_003907 [Oryza meyeriana var. granulata]
MGVWRCQLSQRPPLLFLPLPTSPPSSAPLPPVTGGVSSLGVLFFCFRRRLPRLRHHLPRRHLWLLFYRSLAVSAPSVSSSSVSAAAYLTSAASGSSSVGRRP